MSVLECSWRALTSTLNTKYDDTTIKMVNIIQDIIDDHIIFLFSSGRNISVGYDPSANYFSICSDGSMYSIKRSNPRDYIKFTEINMHFNRSNVYTNRIEYSHNWHAGYDDVGIQIATEFPEISKMMHGKRFLTQI